MNGPAGDPAQALQGMCAVVMMAALLAAAWLLARRTRRGRTEVETVECPRCGADVRETPDRCGNCGVDLPPHVSLRARLIAGDEPPWLTGESEPLELRQPEPDEPYVPLVLLSDAEGRDRLMEMLHRAGISAAEDLYTDPGKDRIFGGHTIGVRLRIEVPAGDLDLAHELLDHLMRTMPDRTAAFAPPPRPPEQ